MARSVILPTYAPILTAYWMSPSYGWTLFDDLTMERFLTLQVFACRLYATVRSPLPAVCVLPESCCGPMRWTYARCSMADLTGGTPRKLIWAWNETPPNVTDDQLLQVALRLAEAFTVWPPSFPHFRCLPKHCVREPRTHTAAAAPRPRPVSAAKARTGVNRACRTPSTIPHGAPSCIGKPENFHSGGFNRQSMRHAAVTDVGSDELAEPMAVVVVVAGVGIVPLCERGICKHIF
jgi:hypothetical protein